MIKRDELLALAERSEGLSGPCRETDADVMQAIGWLRDGYVRAIEHGKERPYFWHGTDEKQPTIYAARFTESIDAAMALVPQNCCVSAMGEVPDDLCWYVCIWREGEREGEPECRAFTPALALAAAALRALAAQGTPDER